MRTRTLLILAAVCSAMILIAGGAQLVLLANRSDQSSGAPIFDVGQQWRSGGLSATPVAVTATGDELQVTMALAFDDDGITSHDDEVTATGHFRLLAGELRPPLGGGGPIADPAGDPADDRADDRADDLAGCGALTTPEQRCTLVFDVSDAPGGARLLVLEWAGEQARWDVA